MGRRPLPQGEAFLGDLVVGRGERAGGLDALLGEPDAGLEEQVDLVPGAVVVLAEVDLVGEAPDPVLTRLGRAGDLVTLGAEVAARVAVRALVAATGLAADEALTKVFPPAALLDARRADVHGRVDVDHPDRVVARRDHRAHRTINHDGTSNPANTTNEARPTDVRRRVRRRPRGSRRASARSRRAGEPPLA